MSIGIWQLLLILVIVFVIFGAGKLPRVMGDVGKGVRSLREGLKGEGDEKDGASKKEIAKDDDSTVIEHAPQSDKDKTSS